MNTNVQKTINSVIYCSNKKINCHVGNFFFFFASTEQDEISYRKALGVIKEPSLRNDVIPKMFFVHDIHRRLSFVCEKNQ